MKLRICALIAFVMALMTMPVFAADLHQARASGQIGEKLDGYVVALKPSPDINALVADVNAKRQAQYAKISQQNGQPVAVVAKVAAAEIIKNADPGSMYQAADGSWKKR
jgi:uncharacterized protein YdbL (DUF1318 family)